MKSKTTYTYFALIALTILVAILSNFPTGKVILSGIVCISVLKFILVGLEFMELKKAHNFWKGTLIVYALLIGGLFVVLL
ncbi:MAG TPA: cytochrome C oxidase subunit IV family protein [Crocinitomicaceae bacterium]|nr:cytochrome C oxidase subunit IV family protein [Crocinitomicaceae bacterium]